MAKTKKNPRAGGAPDATALSLRSLQDLWLATLARPWRSLAMVPFRSENSTVPLTNALCQLASKYRSYQVRSLAALGLSLDDVGRVVDQINAAHARSPLKDEKRERVIIALDSVLDNAFVLPIALTVDAVVLVAELGHEKRKVVRSMLDAIGSDRVLGVVAMDSSG